ncbi:nucleotide disphospho-sugar-binding domain-containing protein [Streptacidiphilus sp. PAMC 29251]
MRILFTAWAWPSHLYAMVPLAWACRAAGHDVLMASQPALAGTMSRTGLPSTRIGRDVDAEAVFRDIVTGRPADPVNPAGQPGTQRSGGGGPRVLNLLVDLADAMVDDLVELGSSWQPDLVVFEPTAFAGPLAAARLGVPAVRHLYGTDLMSVVGGFLPSALAPLAERLGLGGVDPFGTATVDPCPAGLQVPVGSRRLPMRYVPHNGPGVAPRRLPQRSGRPLVCVTWGTTMSRLDSDLFLAGDVARAISDVDADVLLAVTGEQRALLGALPSRTQVAESVPLHLLLPHCDAVVAHGGAGSLLTAVSHGLPQLLLPRLPDHVRHAGRIVEAGAGTVVPAPVQEARLIRDGLGTLLATHSYRESAERLRDEMRSQPAPARVVAELEDIGAGVPVPS